MRKVRRIYEITQEINFISPQKEMFKTGKSVPDRIVSIVKAYIRPIIRGKEVKADDIYATNVNRKYCTCQGIVTNFKRKGRAGKHEGQRMIIAKELRKERVTRMEGSFGTEKQHYSLDKKIKAKTELNEILWIFFGVHAANTIQITKRLAQEDLLRKIA